MEELRLVSDEDGKRIDVWLSCKLGNYSRTYIQNIIDGGNVLVNNKIIKPNYKLKKDDVVTVSIPEPEILDIKPEQINLDIIYEDSDIIVINKPKGMVVHPAPGNYSGTLVNALMNHCKGGLSDINGVIRPGIVHRIDKDTSGVLVVAKNNFAHEKLARIVKAHELKRIYVAIVNGVIRENKGIINAPIGRHPVD